MCKKIIWSSYINTDDWKEAYAEEDSEKGIYEWALDVNNYYLEDERSNLNKKTSGKIIAIADLRFWNGRVQGYKIIGYNIADCLYSEADDAEWYVDDKDFKCDTSNHNGGSHIIYRKLKDDKYLDRVANMIYNNKFTHEDMIRYTTSLKKDISEVYGW